MPVVVIGSFRFPADGVAAARPAMRKVMEATRQEDGCMQYNYAEDVLDPGLIRVSEIWDSRAQLDAHMQAPHMKVWQAERAALGLTERQISVFEAENPAPL